MHVYRNGTMQSMVAQACSVLFELWAKVKAKFLWMFCLYKRACHVF